MWRKINVNYPLAILNLDCEFRDRFLTPNSGSITIFATSKREIALTPQSQKNLIFSEIIERLR
jgi:hypothetical protein